MADIVQDFPIKATMERVFDAVSTAQGLNRWWTERCTGEPSVGSTFALGFGPEFQWRAVVSACAPHRAFELTLTHADADWHGTRVRFELLPNPEGTEVRFAHRGWPAENAHFRVSSHCWALYLRLLRRYLELGETVPYAERLGA